MDTPITPETGTPTTESTEQIDPKSAVDKGSAGTNLDAKTSGSQPAAKGSSAANDAAQKALTRQKYQFKLKVNGEEQVEDLEMDEISRRLQKVAGIEKKAEQAAKQHKTATEFFKLMKENPVEFAKRARENGIMDPDAFAVEIINSKLKWEQMTPEQRELEQLRQKDAIRTKQDKDREEAEHKAKLEQETQEYRESLEKEIVDAFSSVKLPKTPWTTARIAAYIDAGLSNGKQYKVSDVARIVQKEYHSMVNEVLGAFPEDDILNFLKPEIQETISRARVKRLTPAPVIPGAAPKAQKAPEDPKLNPRKQKLSRTWLRRDDTPDE